MKRFANGSFGTLLTLAALVLFEIQPALAQENSRERHIGLTASMQTNQTLILVPIWLGNMMTLAPGVALNYVENSGSNFTFLLASRFYMVRQRVAPYITANVGVNYSNPAGPADQTNLLAGIGIGGEYFINNMFSLGVEALINATIANISGTQTIGVVSTTGINASVYF